MKQHHPFKQFAICVKNDGYEVSLEKRKIYRVLPGRMTDPPEAVRVIDESGQSYLYPENCFISLKLPQAALKALALAA